MPQCRPGLSLRRRDCELGADPWHIALRRRRSTTCPGVDNRAHLLLDHSAGRGSTRDTGGARSGAPVKRERCGISRRSSPALAGTVLAAWTARRTRGTAAARTSAAGTTARRRPRRPRPTTACTAACRRWRPPPRGPPPPRGTVRRHSPDTTRSVCLALCNTSSKVTEV